MTGGRRLPQRSRVIRHFRFAVAVLIGLVIAGLIYFVLAIGECIPRDESAAMHACDRIGQRDLWLYPALFVMAMAGGVTLHVRSAPSAWLMTATSGLIAATALMLVNAFF